MNIIRVPVVTKQCHFTPHGGVSRDVEIQDMLINTEAISHVAISKYGAHVNKRTGCASIEYVSCVEVVMQNKTAIFVHMNLDEFHAFLRLGRDTWRDE